MTQGTAKKSDTLEIAYKTPILRGFLIFLVPLSLYLSIRDLIYGSSGALFFFILQIFFLSTAWFFHLRRNYPGASHFLVFGISLVQIWDLALLGYHDIHSFYLISVVCSLLLLAGAFLLTSLPPLIFHSLSLWVFYGTFITLNLKESSVMASRLAPEAQLAIPTVGFAVSTLLALGSRRVFDQIIRKQEELLREGQGHQKNLGQLIRGFAHRLNTPLGNAKMILSSELPVEGEQRMILSEAIGISTGLISRLKLFLACSESTTLSRSSLSEHLKVLQQHLPRCTITTSPEGVKMMEEVTLHDWETIHLVLKELLENAWQHGHREGTPVAEFSGSEGLWTLRITNPMERTLPCDVEILTQPFYSCLNKPEHPGLGLYFARHLIRKKLGGDLMLELPEPRIFRATISLSPGKIS